jgi:uncharacterized phage-like protein YoqJ
MNQSQLVNLWSGNLDFIRAVDVKDLEGLVRDYPWFLGARWAWLGKLKLENDHQYLDALRDSAPYFSDRSSLKRFLQPLNEEPQLHDVKQKVKREISQVASTIELIQNQLELEQKKEENVISISTEIENFSQEVQLPLIASSEEKNEPESLEEPPIFTLSDFLIRYSKSPKSENEFQVKKPEYDQLEAQMRAAVPYFQLPHADEIPLVHDIAPVLTEEEIFEEPLSDTLARIYEAQGQFLMALAVYEKLNLKFPEKSIYFANRMEAIQQKLKS